MGSGKSKATTISNEAASFFFYTLRKICWWRNYTSHGADGSRGKECYGTDIEEERRGSNREKRTRLTAGL